MISFLKSTPSKTLELIYLTLCKVEPSPTPKVPSRREGGGGYGVCRELLMSFLKSSPLKTLELIYDIIISQVGALFVPQPPPPPDAFGEEEGGGRGLGGLWRNIDLIFEINTIH